MTSFQTSKVLGKHMRKRMIDPGFWADEKVGKLTPHARLLFIASWNLADDEGILNLRPEYLRSNVFMYDNYGISKVTAWSKELTDNELVIPYEVNGQSYGIIKNFLRHQVINKPQPSKLPKPAVSVYEHYGIATVQVSPKRKEEKRKEVKVREVNKNSPLNGS